MSTADNNNSSEKSTDKAETKTAADKPHRKRRHAKKEQHHILLPILGLLLVACIGAGVWLFDTFKQNQIQQQSLVNALQDQIQATQQQADKQVSALQDRLEQQQQSQNELSDNLSTLLKRNDHLRKDWLLGEAEYLVKLASYRLQLERDVSTAMRAMQAADERLRDVGDPALLAVRKVLAEDYNALKNIASADITGMSLTLSALITNIDKLPLNTPTPENQDVAQAPDNTDKNIDSWQELPGAIWDDIKGLVTIRHHDDKIATLLSPKEHFYLLQNLRLQLEQARLALLLGKADVFNERLTAAQAWLTRFFDVKDAGVQNTSENLEKLLSVNIEPELPTIDNSYQALKNYMAGAPVKAVKEKTKPAPSDIKTKEIKKAPEVKPAPKTENKTTDKTEIKPAPDNKVQL